MFVSFEPHESTVPMCISQGTDQEQSALHSGSLFKEVMTGKMTDRQESADFNS